MRHFCTLFDQNYMTRALALYDSIASQGLAFRFYPLCTDDVAFEHMNRLARQYDNIEPLSLTELERQMPELARARDDRTLIEYYFTLSPVLPLYVLDVYDCEAITYLDADLYFYRSPELLYEELGTQSILITEHRFSSKLSRLMVYGRFNVQYQTFRNDDIGRRCLERWRSQCLDWCHDRLDGGRFADQGYLTEWPDLYDRLVISRLKGAGLALWNVGNYHLTHSESGYRVDEDPLVFYHFHSLKAVSPRYFMNDFSVYGVPRSDPVLLELIRGYIKNLGRVAEKYEVPPLHAVANRRSVLPTGLQVLKQALKGNLVRVD